MLVKKYKIQVKNLDLEDPVSTNVKLKTNNISKHIKIDITSRDIYSLPPQEFYDGKIYGYTYNITLPHHNFYILNWEGFNPDPKNSNGISMHFWFGWGSTISLGFRYTDYADGNRIVKGVPGSGGGYWIFHPLSYYDVTASTTLTCRFIDSYGINYPSQANVNVYTCGCAYVEVGSKSYNYLKNIWDPWPANHHGGYKRTSYAVPSLYPKFIEVVTYCIKHLRIRKTNNDTYWK